MRKPIVIGATTVKAGEIKIVDLDVPDLYTHSGITLPVHVIHGNQKGPVLFLSAAVHGDEINGVEIIRRVLRHKQIPRIKGTLIAVPVVNIYGFIHKTRYLPDRRDLNRSFPGSETGSLTARMANVFLREIVSKCTHGIDLHTAAIHRDNLPQVRASLDDAETGRVARAFGLPVILNTTIVPGSLRESAVKAGVTVVVYEAGEALRFDEDSIQQGADGILSVMREIGMLPKLKKKRKHRPPLIAISSTWVRAPESGILRSMKALGAKVEKHELLGIISDPLGRKDEEVRATARGIIIGRTNIPLVNEGEALFHIARFDTEKKGVADLPEEMRNAPMPLVDPPESPII